MREVCRQISEFTQKLLLESLMCCRLFHRFANPISFSGLMFFFPLLKIWVAFKLFYGFSNKVPHLDGFILLL
jgi:hypothetical protein